MSERILKLAQVQALPAFQRGSDGALLTEAMVVQDAQTKRIVDAEWWERIWQLPNPFHSRDCHDGFEQFRLDILRQFKQPRMVDCPCIDGLIPGGIGACQACWKGEGDDWEIIHDGDCKLCGGTGKVKEEKP